MTPTAPDAGRERRLLSVLLAPMFMYQADTTIVNVANPAIGAVWHRLAPDLPDQRADRGRGADRRPGIRWGLTPQAIAISTYFALLFTLALYLQQGLGDSPLISGLTLVPWVAAFGIPGRLLGRIPDRSRAMVAPAGCGLLTLAYVAISAAMLTGHHAEGLLLVLLGIGGFGLGTNFSAILEHLTSTAAPEHAADISGALTTSMQVAGAIGVAGFGTAYLGLLHGPGPAQATHAFGLITATFAATTLVAALAAYRATHVGRRYA